MSTTRKRAALACTHCHRHKVRCDAYSLGLPCTRCHEDGTTCVLRKRAVRRPSFAMTDVPGFQIIEQHSPTKIDLPQNISEQRDHEVNRGEPFSHYSKCAFLDVGDTSALDEADLAFLTAKGCLKVPAKDLVQDFLQQYFLHVQPYTPLMDESMFWGIYEGEPGEGHPRQIQLLLFQAMLFASSPYISEKTLQGCGFRDKRAAWTTLYQRAKLLFDSPLRVDSITRAQAALLLTFYTSTDEPQTANLWLAHAIQAATQASPKPQERMENSPRTVQTSLYDRLWWSILLRDRIITLGLRRRPQVLSFEMNMINGIPSKAEFESEIQGSRVYDPDTRRTLFVAFRDLCQLAVQLTEMVSLIYGHHGLSLPYFTSQDFHSKLALASSIQTSLALWKQSSEISTVNCEKVHTSVTKFVQLTFMYYQAARINLAHYQTLLIKKHEKFLENDGMFHLSRAGEILFEATTGIVSVMEYFSASGKIQDPPLSLLGYLAMPLVLSAIDFKLAPTSRAMRDRRRTMECISQVVSQLRRIYVVADFISYELDKILQLAYHTSSKVFRQGSSQAGSISCRLDSPASHMKNSELPHLISTNNWHDAFLRHTGVYLLMSTTVDYFMSVGRMPQTGVPPEYLCFMSPLDMIQVTWQAPRQFLGANGGPGQQKADEPKSDHHPLQQSPLSSAPNDHAMPDFVSTSTTLSHVPPSSWESSGSGNSLTENGEYKRGYTYGERLDLDFLSFEDCQSTSLILGGRPYSASPQSGSGTDSTIEITSQADQDGYSLDYLLDSRDDFISPMVLECFGLVPLA